MATAQFSKTILQGLQNHGLTLANVGQITGLPVPRLRQVLKEEARFTSKHLEAIETKSGLGLGELVLLAHPEAEADSDFASLMRGWDRVGRTTSKKAIAS